MTADIVANIALGFTIVFTIFLLIIFFRLMKLLSRRPEDED